MDKQALSLGVMQAVAANSESQGPLRLVLALLLLLGLSVWMAGLAFNLWGYRDRAIRRAQERYGPGTMRLNKTGAAVAGTVMLSFLMLFVVLVARALIRVI